jgi:alpha-glucosidase
MKKFLSYLSLFFIALTVRGAPVPTCDQAPVIIDSPEEGKFLQLKFCLISGVPSYSLYSGARTLIEWSRLGLALEKKTGLDQKFKIGSFKRRTYDQTWEQVWGEERYIRNRYNELKIELEQTIDGERRLMNLVFRVFPDGIGFRYEIPRQKSLKNFSIKEELSEFNLTKDHNAWWIDGHSDSDYEQVYKKMPVSKFATAMTPLTIEAEGLYLSIHEAALVDYAGMAIKSEGGGGRLRATLFPWAEGPAVYTKAPMKSPWRTIQVAVSPEKLIESYLVLNLNEPNRIKDTSWIRPGKFIGIWRAMHLGISTWRYSCWHGYVGG